MLPLTSIRGALAALLAAAAHLAAQAPAAEIRVPRIDQSPYIDGALDEPVWDSAAVIDGWVQIEPGDNVAPAARTRAYVMYDRAALYVAVRAESGRAGARYVVHERDQVGSQGQDAIYINIDTFDDRRRAYLFAVNPVGIQGDALVVEGSAGVLKGWDAIFQTAGQVHGDEWTVELAIPFKSLRFPDRPEQRWGISITRGYGGATMRDSAWPQNRGLVCRFCQMAVLTGIGGIARSRNFEANPEALLRGESTRPDRGRPFDSGRLTTDLGLNLKYGFTPSLTLDATLNPDFSQVEADAGQLEINNRFALFYEEKRPFFLEGADIFETGITPPGASGIAAPGGGPQVTGYGAPIKLVHTRRVLDPDAGAKLTGKLGPVTLGLIGVLDGAPEYELSAIPGLRQPASSIDPFDGEGARHLVGRAKLDVMADGFLGATGTWRSFGDGSSAVLSTDGRLRFGRNTTLRYLAASSRTAEPDFLGPAAARLGQELPDSAARRHALAALPATAAAYDGEERDGSALQVQLEYGGRYWTGGLAYVDITPGFETQTGFTPRTDQAAVSGQLAYVHRSRGFFQRIQPELGFERVYDHEAGRGIGRLGRVTDVVWEPQVRFDLPRATDFRLSYARTFLHWGGQDYDRLGRWTVDANSNALRVLRLQSSTSLGDDVIFSDVVHGGRPVAARSVQVRLTATLRPVPPLRFELATSGSRIWRRPGPAPDRTLYAESLIPRLKAQYQHSPRLGFRAIVQYRAERYYARTGALGTSRDAVLSELLASYQVNAGRTLHLGWTQLGAGDLDHAYEWNRRGGVAKLSYTWRL